MNKYSKLYLYLIVLSLCFSGCSKKEELNDLVKSSENDLSIKPLRDNIIDYDKLWASLVKKSTDLHGKVYYGDQLEILALKNSYQNSNPKFNWKYEWEILIYYRNVSEKAIKVPLSTGEVVNSKHRFPGVNETSNGSKFSSWSVFSNNYYNYDVKGSKKEYDFVELLPGEVAVSKRLYYSLKDFESLERLNENVCLEITCDTLHKGHWKGVASVVLPILSKSVMSKYSEQAN